MAARDEDDAHRDLDAPAPPGGPLREDRPDADVNPGQQAENAETALDQPSDGSGGE